MGCASGKELREDAPNAQSDLARLCTESLASFRGEIVLRGSASYDEAVASARMSNNCAPSQPALVLVPKSVEDVMAAMRCAAEGERRGVWGGAPPLTVCGGGHSELCVVDRGITLHMKAMASVVCDTAAGTLTIGAGATFGPAMEASAPHGLIMPSGTAPTVGVGAVLGGGVGKLTRSYGLACDNVVAAEIVLADGSRRMVRDGVEADADLLWAIRGCGAAFGVVTSLVVKAYPVIAARHGCGRASVMTLPEAMAPIDAPEAALAGAVDALVRAEAAARALPPAQSVDLQIGWAPPTPGASPCLMLCTTPTALIREGADSQFSHEACEALHFGDHGATQPPQAAYWPIPFETLTASGDADVGVEVGGDAGEGAGASLQSSGAVLSYVRQVFVDDLGAAGWRLLVHTALAAPSALSMIMLQHGGGAGRTPNAASCFATRRWEYSVLFMALWEPTSEGAREQNMAWADGAWRAIVDAQLATGCYCVDINPWRRPASSAEEVALAFGESLPRLRSLKQALDPSNLLRGGWSLAAEGTHPIAA